MNFPLPGVHAPPSPSAALQSDGDAAETPAASYAHPTSAGVSSVGVSATLATVRSATPSCKTSSRASSSAPAPKKTVKRKRVPVPRVTKARKRRARTKTSTGVRKARDAVRKQVKRRSGGAEAKTNEQRRQNVVCSRARCRRAEFVVDHVKRLCAGLTQRNGPDPLRARACLIYRHLADVANTQPDTWVCADCRKYPPTEAFVRAIEVSEAKSMQDMLSKVMGERALLEGTPL